jgi:hypothetical protein
MESCAARRSPASTARLLQDGVVNSTWTTGTLVFRPEAPDHALEAVRPDGARLFDGYERVVTIGQVSVSLGPCYRVFFHPRVAEVHELEMAVGRLCLNQPEANGAERRSDSGWFLAALS